MVIDNILGYAPNRYMRWHGGIYAIRNLVTDRVYIGATGCFFDRHAPFIFSSLRQWKRWRGSGAVKNLRREWRRDVGAALPGRRKPPHTHREAAE